MGSRMASQLLQELDAIRAINESQPDSSGSTLSVFSLAATNCLSAVDEAFLQPGIFTHLNLM